MSDKPETILKDCATHGKTLYKLVLDRRGSYYRCMRCGTEQSTRGTRKMKQFAIDSLGGSCVVCGYDKCSSALEFHHLDPAEKEEKSRAGITRMSLSRLKEELRKCVLVCANCHREIHAGLHPHLIIPV